MKKIKFSHIDNGYTLIEMMMSVAIIAVVVSGGFAAYSSYTKRQALVNEGGVFVSLAREVQKRAQSGEKPDDCGEEQLQGWRMVIESDGYGFGAYCGEGINEIYVEVDSRALNGGVGLVTTGNIEFEVLSGMVSGIDDVRFELNGDVYQVQISSAGGINNVGLL